MSAYNHAVAIRKRSRSASSTNTSMKCRRIRSAANKNESFQNKLDRMVDDHLLGKNMHPDSYKVFS